MDWLLTGVFKCIELFHVERGDPVVEASSRARRSVILFYLATLFFTVLGFIFKPDASFMDTDLSTVTNAALSAFSFAFMAIGALCVLAAMWFSIIYIHIQLKPEEYMGSDIAHRDQRRK